jgi:hypothetical protein
MRDCTPLAAACVLLITAANSAAQAPTIPPGAWRQGMPDVLVPPPVAALPALPALNLAAFSASYARAGRPAMAVLWNRSFSDMLQQDNASQLSIDSARAGVAAGETVRMPGYSASQLSAAVVGNTTITARDTRSQQAIRGGPVERVDLQMRSAFIQTMAAAGARMVDRNVVMRTTAAGKKGGNDSQQVETEAFLKHARLLLEVLNTRDNASPTGWATYVSIKRLSDGVVLAEGYMDGQAPAGAAKPAPRFEADPQGGFREVVAPAPAPADMGRMAAEQTLARLGEALAR